MYIFVIKQVKNVSLEKVRIGFFNQNIFSDNKISNDYKKNVKNLSNATSEC